MKNEIRLRPSSASEWMSCPYSAKMQTLVEKPKMSTAQKKTIIKGHKIHALVADCIDNERRPEDYKTFAFETEIEGEVFFLEEILSDEEKKMANIYLDYVYSLNKNKSEIETETLVDLKKWIPNGSGTCDCYIVDEENKVLHIVDLKTGRILVEADENKQLLIYALGVYNKLNKKIKNNIEKVQLHIVQPQQKNTNFTLPVKNLLAFGNFVKERAKKCFVKNPVKIPGKKQCEYCVGATYCSANYELRQKPVIEAGIKADKTDVSFGLSYEKRKYIVDNKANLIKFIEKIGEDFIEDIKSGRLQTSEYSVVPGAKRRTWNDKAEAHLYDILGEDAYKPKELIGVLEAENTLKGLGEKIPDTLIDIKYNKDKLVKIKKIQ